MSIYMRMDVNALAAATDHMRGYVNALSSGNVLAGVNQTAFNRLKRDFLAHTDTVAAASASGEPKQRGDFHHLYEENAVGVPTERLFDLVIPRAVRSIKRSEVFARIDFRDASVPQNVYGVLATGNPNAIFGQTEVFREKARVLEGGETVTIPGGTKKIVAFVGGGGKSRLRSYIRTAGEFAGTQTGSRDDYGLLWITKDVQVDTSRLKTHNKLATLLHEWLHGGLAQSAMSASATRMQQTAFQSAIERLSGEIRRANAIYGQFSSTQRGINVNRAGGRLPLTKKYERELLKMLNKFVGDA